MHNMRKYPKLEGVIFIFLPHHAFLSFSYDVLFTGKTFGAIFIGFSSMLLLKNNFSLDFSSDKSFGDRMIHAYIFLQPNFECKNVFVLSITRFVSVREKQFHEKICEPKAGK